jgi:3-oxoacyl-[acyl-carrier protein] reductase
LGGFYHEEHKGHQEPKENFRALGVLRGEKLMRQLFDGQVAIITGAGSGLGAVIARALAAAGARCVLAGRRRAPLENLRTEIGGLAQVIPCDVRDEAQIENLVAQTVQAFDRIDILINNAGVFRMATLMQTTTALFDETLAVNLRGVFLLCRAAWPHLQKSRGQIINVSSLAGVKGYKNNAAYCASKFGVNGLTEVLALEGQPHGIRVSAVCPGSVDTPIWDKQAPAAVRQKMMKPEATAALVVHLLTAPREVAFGPMVVQNFSDPWG